MKLRRSLCGGACWLLVAGFAEPAPRLAIDIDALSPNDGPVADRLPHLEYRLDNLLGAPPRPAEQIVSEAERLLLTGRFDEARPMLDALAGIPEMALQSNFMEGYVALQREDYATAEQRLRTAVAISPEFTRARAELGRALMGLGRREEADAQFQIAERDRSLPQEVQDLIRLSRRITADKTRWSLTVDSAVVADSNVTNGTDLRTIQVNSGGVPREVPVDPAQRRGADVGPSLAVRGGLRVRAGDNVAIALDGEGHVNEYDGTRSDEMSVLVAAGPEISHTSGMTSVQAIAYQRWYGGTVSHEGFGARARYQDMLSEGARIYLYLDARVFDSDYGDDYEGWQVTGLLAYEQVVTPHLSMSGTLYTRREWLGSPVASNVEFGAYYGVNVLLPLGFRGGASGGATRALFDDPLLSLSDDPRRDWRLNLGAYLTTREAVLLGLWPTLSYTYLTTASSIPLYRNDRHRLRLNLRREF